jgi:hypothetical protein
MDAASGRCCASIDSSGACVDPQSGAAPPNPDYGFPDRKSGNALVEGPGAYPDGPSVWSDTNVQGAYGWISNSPPATEDSKCPPIPVDSPLDRTLLTPIALVAHGPPISACMLACNITRISETGIDPCNAGAVVSPVAANYSCFYGGAGWLDNPDLGVCGYNCSIFVIGSGGLQPCHQSDIDTHRCELECDRRQE